MANSTVVGVYITLSAILTAAFGLIDEGINYVNSGSLEIGIVLAAIGFCLIIAGVYLYDHGIISLRVVETLSKVQAKVEEASKKG
jgi:hypothetical protein